MIKVDIFNSFNVVVSFLFKILYCTEKVLCFFLPVFTVLCCSQNFQNHRTNIVNGSLLTMSYVGYNHLLGITEAEHCSTLFNVILCSNLEVSSVGCSPPNSMVFGQRSRCMVFII